MIPIFLRYLLLSESMLTLTDIGETCFLSFERKTNVSKVTSQT